MHEREGAFAVLSGEGRPAIDSLIGRRSGEGFTGDAIYLAGVSGDTITRDRVGNARTGPEDRVITNPMLNVCIMVQPDKYMEAARHPRCTWSARAMADAIEVRFPGGAPVDLKLLCQAWDADARLSHNTLGYCAYLASKLAGVTTAGALIFPKRKLADLIDNL